MRALTSLDSMFIAAEDGRTVANVSSLAILDSADVNENRLTRSDIQELVAQRLHPLPPLRWRLVDVPLGLGHPSWVDCGNDIDLDYHVRETALPAPGGQDVLESLVARLSAHPMDRSRPLWEVYLIHGLRDDRVALLTKLHHAAVDGLSGGEVLNVLFDATAESPSCAVENESSPERAPGGLGMLARAIAEMPRRQLHSAGAARRALASVGRAALSTSTPRAPRLPFNGKITPHRRVALTSLAMGDVLAIKTYFDATVNDVVVALCAGALRRWLADHDQLPEKALVAAIPVSERAPDERRTYGNRVGAMLAGLPTNEPQPHLRLWRSRTELRAAKKRHESVPRSLMRDLNDLVPPIVFGPTVRAVTGFAAGEVGAPVANLVISNVPGPRTPLYFAGRAVREHYPVSAVSDSLGLNVTVFSYVDRLEIGLVADRGLVDDLASLGEAFEQEMRLLMQCVYQPGGSRT